MTTNVQTNRRIVLAARPQGGAADLRFLGLLAGGNFGKLVVNVGADPEHAPGAGVAA